ncbi:hypothetical protein TSOC_001068 [Tetrabaena socialis]|uniref:Uncharacterized protein n=1 Tax=Tetrabaena socialis TaxID=47790 RepID=A0A2J8AHM2_9CHLO|nr:hypothetical protein TSOC_001068 [Tetrabaena socialis]|eukprot:PNH12023.1 hypothetical protein TSOC_001068 [Tetrabaena socialis]
MDATAGMLAPSPDEVGIVQQLRQLPVVAARGGAPAAGAPPDPACVTACCGPRAYARASMPAIAAALSLPPQLPPPPSNGAAAKLSVPAATTSSSLGELSALPRPLPPPLLLAPPGAAARPWAAAAIAEAAAGLCTTSTEARRGRCSCCGRGCGISTLRREKEAAGSDRSPEGRDVKEPCEVMCSSSPPTTTPLPPPTTPLPPPPPKTLPPPP